MNTTRADYVFFNTQSRAERIARLDALATLLDTAILIPGTDVRFRLGALIGLLSGVGDMVTTLLSLYIVKEARALGARLARSRVTALTHSSSPHRKWAKTNSAALAAIGTQHPEQRLQ